MNFWKSISVNADQFYIIHYSSQSLFESEANSGANALSPRITSIVVQHFESRQTISFSTHTIAEVIGVPLAEIVSKYDDIERELLSQFYNWAKDRREKYWVHWNMRNVTFGFEHLEHRYQVLHASKPPSIPVERRVSLTDELSYRYGRDFAPNPKMISLMELNGPRIQGFLTGADEAKAFKDNDFIRMNTSTMVKVEFFRNIITLSSKGKLKTNSKGLLNKIDRLLESRAHRAISFFGSFFGIPVGFYQIYLWLCK
jgi:hypothetical protein